MDFLIACLGQLRLWLAGLAMSVETCPHYLNFASEEVPDGATIYKCAPPIRGRDNREKIWQGLVDGIVDSIASDHSPCPREMKRLEDGDFSSAWGGISGKLQRLCFC